MQTKHLKVHFQSNFRISPSNGQNNKNTQKEQQQRQKHPQSNTLCFLVSVLSYILYQSALQSSLFLVRTRTTLLGGSSSPVRAGTASPDATGLTQSGIAGDECIPNPHPYLNPDPIPIPNSAVNCNHHVEGSIGAGSQRMLYQNYSKNSSRRKQQTHNPNPKP